MGQQFIETIGMYGKKEYKEYPSEYGADIPREPYTIGNIIGNIVFNKQYGIFYYETCSKKEAKIMIKKFENKIKELKKKYLDE